MGLFGTLRDEQLGELRGGAVFDHVDALATARECRRLFQQRIERARLVVLGVDALPDSAQICSCNNVCKGQLIAAVRTLLDQVHLDLQAEAERRGSKRGIGSTVVVLMVNGGHYCALWAGDSRIYLARAGELLQLTEDHSYVQELVNQGVLSPQDAEHHPQSNVITRAVGVDTELRLDKVTNRVQPGDVFLLCSDGLTREVTAEEIRMELMSGDPNRAVRNLIDLALDRGASDNVTAVAVRLAIAPADSPSGRDEEDTNPPPGEMVYGRQGRPTPRPRSHDRPRPFV